MGLRDGQPGAVIGQQRGTGGVSLRGRMGKEHAKGRLLRCYRLLGARRTSEVHLGKGRSAVPVRACA